MTVRVKLFAIVKDKAGRADLTLALPAGASVKQAIEQLGDDYPATRDYLPRAAFAVNLSYVPADTILNDGDELAVIPPVSGG